MAFTVNTNIASLQAQNYLRTNSDFQAKTINRVTSGLRIVTSGDDAAGLAIANGFRSDQAVLNQGIRNANDGLSTLQTIDGGMNNISQLLDRARTLATQSASGTFIGDRSVLNSEFQSVLGEIDRQAQAVGLNQGGQFAVKLSVFVGGGKSSNGITGIDNGSVSVDLSQSTVDSKSLGLKGVQAMGASAVDLSSGQASSVENIVGNLTNKGSESATGYTDFFISGPGFADGSKVKVSVNLSGVTDTNTLVAAVNAAITNAGNGTTAAATAFKNAGVTASVVTDATGKHLAFSSATTAFQVEAGDRMSNALLGNVTGSTGNSLDTTVTGSAATAALASTAAAAETVHVRIQGASMTSPKDLTISIGQGDLVSSAVDSLTSAVLNDSDLKAAGITVARDSGTGKLVFTSTKGESFSALATGDTANLFGMGSFKMGGTLGDQVEYNTITAGANYDPTAALTGGQSTFEFSLSGAASNAAADKVAIDLAGGDATAAKVTGTGNSASYSFTAGNNQLAIAVDGVAQNITLPVSGAATAATVDVGSFVVGGATLTDNTADKLTLTIDGVTRTVDLGGTGQVTAANMAIAINGVFNPLLGGDVAAAGPGGTSITLTSRTTGAGSSISVDSTSNAAAALGIGADVNVTGTAAGAATTASDVANAIETAIGSSNALVTVNSDNTISITAANKGTGHSIQVLAGTANATLGFTEGNLVTGDNRSGADLAAALNDAFSTKTDLQAAGLTATYASNKLTIASNNGTNFRLNDYASGSTSAASLIGTKSVLTGANFNLTGANVLDITADGAAAPVSVTLTSGNMTAVQIRDAINGTTNVGVTASVVTDNGRDFLKIVSNTTGAASSVALSGSSLAVLGLAASATGSAGNAGFGTAGATFTGNTASAAPAVSASVLSGGAFQTSALDFSTIKFGGDSQVITVSANDSNGVQRSQDITLANNSATPNARNIDEAIHAINTALQQSNVSVLQNVVAMKVDVGGVEKIQFASGGTGGFNVSIGATANGGGFATTGTVTAQQQGTGSTSDIGNQAAAQKAVDALASAVNFLGSAQAVVGKGQNNFNYAVNLAQSQVTNLAAAESRIRDADLASEAANLSKAQILIQAGTAALAQANSAPQAILSLLRG